MGLIRSYNDGKREHEIRVDGDKELFIRVVEKLIEINDWSSENILLKAELYREIGQFDRCEAVLYKVGYWALNSDERHFYDNIKKMMNKRETDVFEIRSEEEERKIRDKELMEIEIARYREWREKESMDTRWKVCKNGHCFDSLESSCRWCGETEVAERLDKDTHIDSQKLYVGKVDKKWILIRKSDIEGQTERIRSITVDYNGKYKFYYHMDGKNPHPFSSNNIKLNDEVSIKGIDLTRACDKILSGEDEEVILLDL